VSINIAHEGGGVIVSVDEIRAVPGSGLEGDRYYTQPSHNSHNPKPGREVTLIENEAIDALQHEVGISLSLGNARRNLVTRGVPLNHLVDKQFKVGEVILKGVQLCEPCKHLEELTQPGVLAGLIHRGGLRAEILNEGIIRVGDSVEEMQQSNLKETII